MKPAERRAFFGQRSTRLHPAGHLVSADLSSGTSASAYENLLEVWFQMQRFNGVPEEAIQRMRLVYGRDVAVSTPQEIEAQVHPAASISCAIFSSLPNSCLVCQASDLDSALPTAAKQGAAPDRLQLRSFLPVDGGSFSDRKLHQ